MRQPPAHAAEPAAVRDEQIGVMFRNMRLAMKVPRETIARRLATTSATIESFEAGAISALPHGKETARIIRAYCELLRMDPEPILWRMRELLQAPPTEVRTASTSQQAPAPRAFAPATPSERARAEAPPSRRRRVRTLFALSAPVAAAAGVAMLVHVAPGPVYRAVGLLPEVIEWPVRVGLDYAVLATAPRREGLKWIEVGDPRLRKVDKLQTSAR